MQLHGESAARQLVNPSPRSSKTDTCPDNSRCVMELELSEQGLLYPFSFTIRLGEERHARPNWVCVSRRNTNCLYILVRPRSGPDLVVPSLLFLFWAHRPMTRTTPLAMSGAGTYPRPPVDLIS